MEFKPALPYQARWRARLAPLLAHRWARPVVAGAAVLSLALLGAGVALQQRLRPAIEAQRAALARSGALEPAVLDGRAQPAQDGDFARRLPAQPAEPQLLAVLQGAAAQAHVTVAEVQFGHRRAATVTLLGRSSATVVLHGPYAGLKSVLAEVLARVEGASVQQLSLRRGAGAVQAGPGAEGQSLDATWTLSLWSRPLLPDAQVPAGAASAPRP